MLLLVPPPLVILQNLEKTRFILRLSARSLSLKELREKFREHGSYGRQAAVLAPVLELGSELNDGKSAPPNQECCPAIGH